MVKTTKKPVKKSTKKSTRKTKNPLFSVQQKSDTWVINVVADPENPDFAFIEFPDDFVESSGWQVGDKIRAEVLPEGILLRRVIER